jgi:hypothetical protein
MSDDGYRWDAVDAASYIELESILTAVDGVPDDVLFEWLGGPEADVRTPSREYVAITGLTMAADHARMRLKRR